MSTPLRAVRRLNPEHLRRVAAAHAAHNDARATATRYVVRRGGFDVEKVYLQPDGRWGPRSSAKRFNSQDDAEAFYRRFYSSNNFGVFPA